MAGTSTATENMLPIEVPKAGPNEKDASIHSSSKEEEDGKVDEKEDMEEEACVLAEVLHSMGIYLDRASRNLLKAIPRKDDDILKVRKWALEVARSRTVDKDFDTDKIFWRGPDIYSPPEDPRYGVVLRTDEFGLFDHQDGLSVPIRRLLTADVARLVRVKKALDYALSERRRRRQQEGQQHDLDVAEKKSMRPTLGSNGSSNRSKEQGLGDMQQSSLQPSAVRRMFRHWKEAWNEGTIEDNILLIAFTLLTLGIILSALVYTLLLLSRLGHSLGHIYQGR